MNFEYRFMGKEYSISLNKSDNGFAFAVGSDMHPLNADPVDNNTFMISLDGARKLVHVAQVDGKIYVHLDGCVHVLEDIAAQDNNAHGGADEILDGVQRVMAPMPGKLVKVTVEDGQMVTSGTTVCIVEAMKMENVVQSRIDGRVGKIAFSPGDLVDTDTPILEIVAEAAPQLG